MDRSIAEGLMEIDSVKTLAFIPLCVRPRSRSPMNVPLRNRYRGVASDSRQRENIAARLR